MNIKTHLRINHELCGRALEMAPGYGKAVLTATSAMGTDDNGVVHGGFTFGLADYACMLAVNEPAVGLGKVECEYLGPVFVGDELVAEAEIQRSEGADRLVRASVSVQGKEVFRGLYACFII